MKYVRKASAEFSRSCRSIVVLFLAERCKRVQLLLFVVPMHTYTPFRTQSISRFQYGRTSEHTSERNCASSGLTHLLLVLQFSYPRLLLTETDREKNMTYSRILFTKCSTRLTDVVYAPCVQLSYQNGSASHSFRQLPYIPLKVHNVKSIEENNACMSVRDVVSIHSSFSVPAFKSSIQFFPVCVCNSIANRQRAFRMSDNRYRRTCSHNASMSAI